MKLFAQLRPCLLVIFASSIHFSINLATGFTALSTTPQSQDYLTRTCLSDTAKHFSVKGGGELLSLQTEFTARMTVHHAFQRSNLALFNETLTNLTEILKAAHKMVVDSDVRRRVALRGGHLAELVQYLKDKVGSGRLVDLKALLRQFKALAGVVQELEVEMRAWREELLAFEKKAARLLDSMPEIPEPVQKLKRRDRDYVETPLVYLLGTLGKSLKVICSFWGFDFPVEKKQPNRVLKLSEYQAIMLNGILASLKVSGPYVGAQSGVPFNTNPALDPGAATDFSNHLACYTNFSYSPSSKTASKSHSSAIETTCVFDFPSRNPTPRPKNSPRCRR
ncbi:hypothetical protein B2J93_8792 [Marssonina coronariae]|uniref:Uncharacterized protein n=1 Tax=Diplocarpon coronariae TaxID=2795749 RepID=A0A218YUV0_9HELO|nr:hypothetical protein B2J93_8792 [Marssonina coronariae]